MALVNPHDIFDRLIVLSPAGKNKRNEPLFKCRCTCGNITVVKQYNLRSGHTKSCGCLGTGTKPENLSGKVFGSLRVIRESTPYKCRTTRWVCLCVCGKQTIAGRGALLTGRTRSCGCFSLLLRTRQGKHHPHFNPNVEHGVRRTPGYRSFCQKVLQKHRWTCVRCGYKHELAVHHKNNYAQFKSQRKDIQNGVVLCKPCHLDFHMCYTTRNNTAEQFEEWLYNVGFPRGCG